MKPQVGEIKTTANQEMPEDKSIKKAMKQSTMTLILNGISILVLLVTVSVSVCSLMASNAANLANQERFELTYNANRFMNGSSYLTNEVRAYAATGDRTHYDNYWNEINVLKNRDIGVARMKEIGITDEELSYIDQMSELSDSLVPLESAAMDDAAAGRMDEALEYVYGDQYSEAIAQINTLKSTFLEKLDERALAEVQYRQNLSHILQAAVYVTLALVAVMQGITIFVIRTKFIRPINKVKDEMTQISEGNLRSEFDLEPDTSEIGMMVNAMLTTKRFLQDLIQDISRVLHHMAQGNMDQKISADYANDFGPIKVAINQILDSLNDALTQITLSSNQVAGGASQVSDSATALSQGATQQASAVQELTATINEISTQVEQIAQNASSAESRSLEASGQVDIGHQKMQELTQAMEEISSASTRISSIIKTIEDIAFQTNILALNAAVEASRAGAAGKGFAVVADEVRSLADKSSQAAKDSTALIEGTLKMVRTGSELTAQATQVLESVVVGAKDSTEYVQKIAAATDQQAGALRQVSEGLDQISSVVQNNAAAAEEEAASAAELMGQADRQKTLVGQFHLRRGEP